MSRLFLAGEGKGTLHCLEHDAELRVLQPASNE